MPDESGTHSVTNWLAGLKAGDAEATGRLAARYWSSLESLARDQLKNSSRSVADEEDIVVSVLKSLCRRAAAGGFGDVSNREELWWLLLAITKRKVISEIRRQRAQKRGLTKLTRNAIAPNDSWQFPLDYLVGEAPTPETLVSLHEQYDRLLGQLRDDTFRRIVVWRMEGYSSQEIAERLGIAKRSIERKLALVRKKWIQEIVQ